MNRKSISKVCMLLAAWANVGPLAFPQQASSESSCPNRTLNGDFGTLVEGSFVSNGWPLRTASMMHFDGRGSITTTDFVVLNGTPLSPTWTQKTGTYSVNADCTATFLLEGVIATHFMITNNGKEIRGVVDGEAITFTASRVH